MGEPVLTADNGFAIYRKGWREFSMLSRQLL
jgi:hypothetical protein